MREILLPLIGPAAVHLDRVHIASSTKKAELKASPLHRELKRLAHSVDVKQRNKFKGRYKANIDFVCTEDTGALRALTAAEQLLGTYSVTEAEVALDGHAASLAEAEALAASLIRVVGKPRHYRQGIEWAWKPPRTDEERHELERKGLFDQPTYYFEASNRELKLKIYIRREKRANGQFGGCVVRIEWTLNYRAVRRYFGGNTIRHLLEADLASFVDKQLILEEVVWVAVGKLAHTRWVVQVACLHHGGTRGRTIRTSGTG